MTHDLPPRRVEFVDRSLIRYTPFYPDRAVVRHDVDAVVDWEASTVVVPVIALRTSNIRDSIRPRD